MEKQRPKYHEFTLKRGRFRDSGPCSNRHPYLIPKRRWVNSQETSRHPRVDQQRRQQHASKCNVEDPEATGIGIRTLQAHPIALPSAIFFFPEPSSLFLADFVALARSWFDSSHTHHQQPYLDRFEEFLALPSTTAASSPSSSSSGHQRAEKLGSR